MVAIKTKGDSMKPQIIRYLAGNGGISFVEFTEDGKTKILSYKIFVKRYGEPKGEQR